MRGDSVAGYGVLSIAAGEAHILNICASIRSFARTATARLLDEILFRARAASVRRVFLEVRPSNERRSPCTGRRAFIQIANRPAYYQAHDGREDAAVLSKKLIED